MKLVIVESPAKAKTIGQYLGKDYKVIASFGHVRDLLAKDGAVDPDHDFDTKWEISSNSKSHLSNISKSLKDAEELILATDPDREGEAISWHLLEYFNEKKHIKKNTSVSRVTFNAVTKKAVKAAMENPRQIDHDLVDAYLARRCLDYLVGFKLSPVLWRKLPGAKSAGRVQSVALRLVIDRENEIESFDSREYWTIESQLLVNEPQKQHKITARLASIDEKTLDKFAIANEAQAKKIVTELSNCAGEVADIIARPEKRSPTAPFTTSTLQQEASRKLNLSARDTMSIAQRLYEGISIGGEIVGLITYMRTDAVSLSAEAVSDCRSYINSYFGDNYLPAKPRSFKTSARITQEAHEAIRPTEISRNPSALSGHLYGKELELYRLIWNRTVASQMADAQYHRTTIKFNVQGDTHAYGLSTSGAVQVFDGFLKLYSEGIDDPAPDSANKNAADSGKEVEKSLPKLSKGSNCKVEKADSEQHFTKPPPRYTEASLIKEMEKVGIGRPSTYTSTLSVLRDRAYVYLENKRMLPETRGRLVTAFLKKYFTRYVDYEFTANLENDLDRVAQGDFAWKKLLENFWKPFHASIDDMGEHDIGQVLEAITPLMESFLFPAIEGKENTHECPRCGKGNLFLRLGKYGAFLGCDQYPECRYVKSLDADAQNDAVEVQQDIQLGINPKTGRQISVKSGRFGPYVEEALPEEVPTAEDAENTDGAKPAKRGSKSKTKKPPRMSLPAGLNPQDVKLDLAINLLSLPRKVGTFPDDNTDIFANLGRYGPYISCEKTNVTLEKWEDVFDIQDNRAITLIHDKREGRLVAKKPRGMQALKSLGIHPTIGSEIEVFNGRFGPYVKCDGVNATIPRGFTVEEVELDDAVLLIDKKIATGTTKTKAKKVTKKVATKKATTKKATTKKATVKKATTKKVATKKTTTKNTTTKKTAAT